MIKATHLTKQYGVNMALYDANFEIQKGEVVGFLGPNGAGKSTTMNMLCGYLEPTWGQIEIAGVDMAEEPLEAKRHIGYLPEFPPLYMDMTVEEQLQFACSLRGMNLKKEARRDYIASLCGRTQILDTRKRLIRNLSKGYRQRVAVTQLLVGDPEILILDEPTVGLDPRQIREFRDLFVELGQDHTIILSSHILSEISSICRRILVFNEGLLIADGQPERLQEMLTGRKGLQAEIAGDQPGVTAVLKAIPGVLAVKPAAQTGEDSWVYQIDHQIGTDIRAAVYHALKETDYALLMMKPEDVSLESIYLKITEDQEGGPEETA